MVLGSIWCEKPVWCALVSDRIRLLDLHLVKIQPQLAHIGARLNIWFGFEKMGKDLFDGGGTLADGVEGAWVAVVDKVGGVVVGARATIILMQGSIWWHFFWEFFLQLPFVTDWVAAQLKAIPRLQPPLQDDLMPRWDIPEEHSRHQNQQRSSPVPHRRIERIPC